MRFESQGFQGSLECVLRGAASAAPFVDVCYHSRNDVSRIRIALVEDFSIARFPNVPGERITTSVWTSSGKCGARKIAQGWCKSSVLEL